jgi:vacuolar-type H+-ATPase subunit H
VDILQLIDRIEELLDSGWRVPMSKRVAIDEEAFLNIIDQMRITVPQEIKQAREVALERDKYIAQAHEEARRIIAQAREDAAAQLDEHVLRQQAEERASTVLKKAVEEATLIRAGADEYAEGKLRELGRQLERLQAVVANGLSTIEERRVQRAPAKASAGAADVPASEAAPPKEEPRVRPQADKGPQTDARPQMEGRQQTDRRPQVDARSTLQAPRVAGQRTDGSGR